MLKKYFLLLSMLKTVSISVETVIFLMTNPRFFY